MASDEMNRDELVTVGVIATVYFKIKEDAGTGSFSFTFDNEYTKMNNKSAVTTTNTTLSIYQQLDNDTSLSSITVTSGGVTYQAKQTFSPTTKTYNVYLPNNVSSVDVAATPTKTTTTITSGTGSQSLSVSTMKTVEIKTKAQDNSTDTYYVKLYRLSNDADLSSLTLSGINYGTFNSNTTSYSVTVPYTTSSTTVSATPHDTKASVSGTTTKNLSVGSNTISVEVTPENCKSEYSSATNNTCTKKTYTVTVTREAASENALLSDLRVDNVQVPQFASNKFDYSLSDVVYSTGSVNVTATLADTTATIVSGTGTKNLAVGANTISVLVRAQSGHEETYTISIKRLSNDATLKSLTVTSSDGSLSESFSPSKTIYTYTVGPDVTEITVNGVKNHTGATVAGNRTYSLSEGKAEILVTAESGNTNTYVINFVRNRSTNADLSALSVQGRTLTPSTFNKDTLTYSLTVPSTVDKVNILATLADTRASKTGDGERNISVGLNPLEVHVVAEDETTDKTYTINVTKQSGDATLSNLTLSGIDFGTFTSDTTTYTVTVPYTTSSTTVSATKHDSKATIVTASSTLGNQELSVGANEIKVLVKAEDPNVTNEYKVTVTREAASDNALLSDLKVDNVQVPDFAPDRFIYNLDDVASTKSSVNITAVAQEEHAGIEGDGVQVLSTGANQLRVIVTPQSNGTPSTYTINIKKLNNDTTLKSLSVTSDDGSLSPSTFNSATKEYTYTVGPDVTEVTINGLPTDDNALVEGNNTYNPTTTSKVELIVKAEDRNVSDKYTINLVRTLSDNNNLSNLEVVDHELNETFKSEDTEYTLSVTYDTDRVNIIATLADPRGRVEGDGEKELAYGDNEFTIYAYAENGSRKPYTLTITRPRRNTSTLSGITINGVPLEGFTPDNTEYDLGTLTSDVTSLEIGVTLTDPLSSVDGDGTVELAAGDNEIEIIVTAQDGVSQTKYTLSANRTPDSNTYLSSLTVTGQDLDPVFIKTTTDYALVVNTSVTSIEVSAVPEASTSRVTTELGTINLVEDETTITITVKAEDNSTRDYHIVVTKEDDAEFITSFIYGHTIENGMIKTVAYKTKPEQLKDQLDNDNEKLEIWDKDETRLIGEDENLGTGMIVKLIVNGVEKDRKIIVVKGDVDGNGEIALLDAVMVLNHFLEKTLLTGVYYEAGNTNSDEEVALLDAVNILKIYLSE